MQEYKPLGYYNYTVVLTYIGMLTGFLGITYAMEGRIDRGLICLMVAGVCDMFDGAVAATMQRSRDEKNFGIQIDSLSDLICFGVLPALILVKMDITDDLAYAVASLYVLSALIRLAYFNVDEQKRQEGSEEGRKYYLGLPVTMIAVIMPFFYGLHLYFRKSFLMTAVMALVGTLFLTPVKIKKVQVMGKVMMALCGILELCFLILSLGEV